MTLGEKLAKHRKENNYTQEQLAEILGVSRQAISKWESDIAYPETEKLIRIGKLFDCSMDYLLNDDITEKDGSKTQEETNVIKDMASQIPKILLKERKSKKTVFGMPLYHIGKKAHGFFAVGLNAKGVFAIGLKATGIVSLGLLSFGVLSIGLLSLGILAFGNLALGLFAFGSIAAGLVAAGAISLGVISVGSIAVGQFSVGALAIGHYAAIGDNARAMIAIGESEAVGSIYRHIGSMLPNEIEHIKNLLDENIPTYFSWAKEFMKIFIK